MRQIQGKRLVTFSYGDISEQPDQDIHESVEITAGCDVADDFPIEKEAGALDEVARILFWQFFGNLITERRHLITWVRISEILYPDEMTQPNPSFQH